MPRLKSPKAEKATKAAGLNQKQEACVLAFIETGNQSEAYRRVYPRSQKWKPEALHIEASRYFANPKISLRVEELRAKLRRVAEYRHEITVDSLTAMLRDAYNLAMTPAVSSPAAAVSAILGLGKLHGLIVEKKHVTGDHKHHHSSEPVSESATWLAGMLGTRTHRAAAQSLPH